MVREFDYDPQALEAEMREKGSLELQLKKQFVSESIIVHVSNILLSKSGHFLLTQARVRICLGQKKVS